MTQVTEVTVKVVYIIISVTGVTTVTESPIMACGSGLASTEFGYPNSLVRGSAPNTLNKGGI